MNDSIRRLRSFLRDSHYGLTNKSSGCIKSLRSVLHQLDWLIVKLHSKNSSSIILGNDSDFMMLIGGASIKVKYFKHCTCTIQLSNTTLIISRKTLAKEMYEKLLNFGEKSSVSLKSTSTQDVNH